VGKVFGVFFMTWLTLKLKISHLPEGMSLKQVAIVGILAGVGFTMSLFIAGLAYDDAQHLTEAKLGVILASITAGTLGYFTLKKYFSVK
jgi:NhaA family Na+:H+ antiporter